MGLVKMVVGDIFATKEVLVRQMEPGDVAIATIVQGID
jgi:hypothetical protein